MDQNLALVGALCVGLAIVVAFFMFCLNIGALSAFGRRPLSWRKLGLMGLGAFIPGLGLLGCLALCGFDEALAYPPALAGAMALLGWLSMLALGQLEEWALDGAEKALDLRE